MPLTFSNLAAGYDSTGATTSSPIPSVTLKKNQLALATVIDKSGTDSVSAVTIAGVSFTKITSISDGWSPWFMSVWRAMPGADATGTGTIAHANAICRWSVDMSNTVVDTTGVNGAGAIVQALTAAAATKTLAALGNSANVAFGAISSEQSTAITAGSGFTPLGPSNNTDGSALMTEWQTNVTVVNATATSHPSIIALEIKAGAATAKSGAITQLAQSLAQGG